MRVTILKEWQTEATVETPDGLSHRELKEWLANKADEVGNDLSKAEWSATYCIETETNEDVCDW